MRILPAAPLPDEELLKNTLEQAHLTHNNPVSGGHLPGELLHLAIWAQKKRRAGR
jgi:hypothetical protein